MKLSTEMKEFSERLGHEFAKPELLIRALTHPSMTSPHRDNNQRLEFLGDRVLGLSIAEALFKADKGAAEGVLAPRFNALVRKETCAEVARAIDLGAVLKLGRSEMKSGGRRKDALLGDAMEAVIAAIYLDAGFPAARDAVLRLWGDRIDRVETDARDPKTALQEWAQGRGHALPAYRTLSTAGPAHAPHFVVEAEAAGRRASGEGGSKREAERAAAAALLAALEAP